jgi:hypothetical protein
LALNTYQTPVGRLNLVQDYNLTGDEYDDYMFIVNQSDLEYTYLEGLDMHLETDKQANNVKEQIDELWGCLGLGIHRPEMHAYIHNIRAGA